VLLEKRHGIGKDSSLPLSNPTRRYESKGTKKIFVNILEEGGQSSLHRMEKKGFFSSGKGNKKSGKRKGGKENRRQYHICRS